MLTSKVSNLTDIKDYVTLPTSGQLTIFFQSFQSYLSVQRRGLVSPPVVTWRLNHLHDNKAVSFTEEDGKMQLKALQKAWKWTLS